MRGLLAEEKAGTDILRPLKATTQDKPWRMALKCSWFEVAFFTATAHSGGITCVPMHTENVRPLVGEAAVRIVKARYAATPRREIAIIPSDSFYLQRSKGNCKNNPSCKPNKKKLKISSNPHRSNNKNFVGVHLGVQINYSVYENTYSCGF